MENIESEVNLNESEGADQLPEGLVEETDETEVSLDEAVNEDTAVEAETAEEQPEPEQETEPVAKEPGYVKGRIEKAVAKVREEYEGVLNPLREQVANLQSRLLKMDAQELVKKGEFRSVETAEEYLRLKNGLPASTIEKPNDEGQPRNANGQFASKKANDSDAAIMARIDMLKHQAAQIKSRQGIDVIEAYNKDPKIKQRIQAGEVDFYDIAVEMASKPKRAKPPAPMRSPNGAATTSAAMSILDMDSKQFARLVEKVQGGTRIREN